MLLMQAPPGEILKTFAAEGVSFGRQQRSLEVRRVAKSAQRAGRADHAVIRQAGLRRVPQNIADRAGSTGAPRQSSHIAVRGDSP